MRGRRRFLPNEAFRKGRRSQGTLKGEILYITVEKKAIECGGRFRRVEGEGKKKESAATGRHRSAKKPFAKKERRHACPRKERERKTAWEEDGKGKRICT